MQRSKVDLPDPDGPRMLIVSPEWILKRSGALSSVEEVGAGILDGSGHLSYLPGNEWILSDTLLTTSTPSKLFEMPST